MHGNTGKIAWIDLARRAVEIIELPEELYRRFIGGSGLAAKLFWDRADFAAGPLAPEALLVLMNGPLAGARLSGASRMSAAARSPLTGAYADSSCGGFFPPALRHAGFDGLAVTGKAAAPSLLRVADGAIAIEDASFIRGRGVFESTAALDEKYGTKAASLVIGPAGENLVPYACVLNRGHHVFGRCGMGAVMGSKNLKAIVAEPAGKDINWADPDKLGGLIRELTPRARDHLISQVLRDFGTAGNLEGHMYDGDVPIRNWTSNFNEEMGEELTGSTLSERYLTKTRTCAYCAVSCKRVVRIDDGPCALPEGPGPEYETVAAFGALLGSADLAAVCKAGRVCNDLGIDTISAGATIAWAMEAFEKGHLTEEHTGGIPLQWADMETVINTLLPAIARRDPPLGALLSLGSAAAAKTVGRGSIEYTAQCKGLEAPMHDPRAAHGHALSYAVSPRGACHVETAMHFMESGACNYPEIGFEFDLEALTHEKKAETMVLAAAIGAIENSACLCQFADRSFTIPEIVSLINACAGYGYTVESMMEAGLRIFHLKRCLNHRYGMTAADDELSARLKEPARDGETAGVEINFDDMKRGFYKLMDFHPEKGVASAAKLETLGLIDEAKIIWRE